MAEVQELARQQTDAAIRALVEIMQRSKSPAARVSAAQTLLDRGWGKPCQPVAAEIRQQVDLTRLSDEELAQLERIYTKALPAQEPGGPPR